jgi:hypothetical protein
MDTSVVLQQTEQIFGPVCETGVECSITLLALIQSSLFSCILSLRGEEGSVSILNNNTSKSQVKFIVLLISYTGSMN